MKGQQVLQLLSDYEKIVGDLYMAYSRFFADQEAFWKELSEEEYRHAAMVLSMQELLEGREILYTGRFNETAITNAIKFVTAQLAALSDGTVKRLEAHTAAASIEASLLESKGFEAFSGKAHEFHKVKEILLEETRVHRDKIREAMKDMR
ncbi:MAG: hypothetical protein PHU03_04410 [Syntrophales bacterium]|nr:hypothetical protein [Syntrophales bacterium]